MSYVVYRGVFSNGKLYIGITNDYERRLNEHKHSVNKKDRVDYPLYKALRKYGWDDVKWSIIDTCETLEEAKDREIFYIEHFNCYNKGGYNASKGGDYPSSNCYIYEDSLIDEIKESLIENKLTLLEISTKFNVSISYVSNILNCKIRNKDLINRTSLQSQKGSNNKASKLTEEQVSTIKKKLLNGVSRKVLKEEYCVSKSLIQSIAVGDSWSHVEPKIPMAKKRTQITKELLIELKERLQKNETSSSLQKEFKVSPNTIVKVKKGEYDHLLEKRNPDIASGR